MATQPKIKKTTKPKPTAPKKRPTAAKSSAAIVKDILAQLKSKGDAKVRTLNVRNGAGDKQFGVKLGDIRGIAKKIKPNHELGMALWDTRNLEAQLITTLLIKAKDLSAAEMEAMVESVTVVQVFEWLHSYVTKDHPDKESLRQKWMTTNHPMAARAGWRLTAGRVAKNPEGIDEVALLNRIETEMAHADPLVQWTMNMCLAEIGIHFQEHRERAIAIGEKLGIYRDYPCSPGCTSPFAPIWINEMVKRQG
ncbi:MAG TPA: DNA alkylation repair protein [Gemmatales bacterium]|nr:DNA alkylation repair protein [Gemmatales bacterium]